MIAISRCARRGGKSRPAEPGAVPPRTGFDSHGSPGDKGRSDSIRECAWVKGGKGGLRLRRAAENPLSSAE